MGTLISPRLYNRQEVLTMREQEEMETEKEEEKTQVVGKLKFFGTITQIFRATTQYTTLKTLPWFRESLCIEAKSQQIAFKIATHVKIFSGNDPSKSKNMREIQFWHFRSEKTLSWFREGLCIEAKRRKIAFLRFFASIRRSSLNQGSTSRFGNARNRFFA
jgi:hypothetical protein